MEYILRGGKPRTAREREILKLSIELELRAFGFSSAEISNLPLHAVEDYMMIMSVKQRMEMERITK